MDNINGWNKTENNSGYLKISNILKNMHISVPKIIKSDLKKGNFLIEDFGINSYKNFLKKKMNINFII